MLTRLCLTFFLITMAPKVWSQLSGSDTTPGSSCAGFPSGATRMTADADLNGRGVILVCNGSTWEVEKPTFVGTCNDGDAITYHASSGGFACVASCADQTPNAFNFTDQTGLSTSTLYTSNILQISGISCLVSATISGEGSPQFRICTDSGCSSVVQDWTSSSALITNNQYVQIRTTSSAAPGDLYTVDLVVGGAMDSWNLTAAGDCTPADPAVGTICSDGSIYVGKSPDGNLKMYITRCDEGLSWNGAQCVGTQINLPWNNDDDNFSNPGTNDISGSSNTATMVANGNIFRAAEWCPTSTSHGQSDWYLPSRFEAELISTNLGATGNFSNVNYWTSSFATNQDAWAINYATSSSTWTSYHNSNSQYRVRCARK